MNMWLMPGEAVGVGRLSVFYGAIVCDADPRLAQRRPAGARRCCGAAKKPSRCALPISPCWCVTVTKRRLFAMRCSSCRSRRSIFQTATAYLKPRKRRSYCGCCRRYWRQSVKTRCAARWRRRCLALMRRISKTSIRMNVPGMRW